MCFAEKSQELLLALVAHQASCWVSRAQKNMFSVRKPTLCTTIVPDCRVESKSPGWGGGTVECTDPSVQWRTSSEWPGKPVSVRAPWKGSQWATCALIKSALIGDGRSKRGSLSWGQIHPATFQWERWTPDMSRTPYTIGPHQRSRPANGIFFTTFYCDNGAVISGFDASGNKNSDDLFRSGRKARWKRMQSCSTSWDP